MTVLSALRPDASLPEFLAHRARSASVRRLSIDLAVGAAGFSAAFRWHPSVRLVVASIAVMLFAYGAWGIVDRARSAEATRDRGFARGSLDALCFLLAGAGALATGALLYSVWALALGTWIS